MIRTLPDLLKLENDALVDAVAARAAGWMIDEDFWWVRQRVADEPARLDHAEFGFVDSCFVFCPSAAGALAYDRAAKGDAA
jgi:hypothetical protein